MARRDHPRRIDDQDDRATVPRADRRGGGNIGREVDGVPRHRAQTFAEDRGDRAGTGAVVEDGGRIEDRQS